jgi:hypothetical protein
MADDLGTDGMRKVSWTCPKCNRDRVCSQEEAKEVYQSFDWVDFSLDDVEYIYGVRAGRLMASGKSRKKLKTWSTVKTGQILKL